MKQVNVKKLILPNIPYVFIALLATKVSEAVRLAPGSDASAKLLNIMTGLNTAFHSLVPSFHPIDLCVGVAAAIAIRLAVYIKGKNAKKFRKNLEYGSARWGTAEDIKPYVDPAFENNIILTQTERLTMNSRPKDPKTARNKNVLIVGGSGSGKTRFWLKPNLLQCTSKTYVAYRKAGYSKKFLAEHESEVTIHKAAKNYFDGLGLKKLPTIKALNTEYAELLAEKKAAYADYRKAREKMKELLTAKANIDRILELDKEQEESNERREQEAEQR